MYQTNRSSGSHALKEKDKDAPSVRFKIQYQVVSILPLKAYDDFLKVGAVHRCMYEGERERRREREREGRGERERGERDEVGRMFEGVKVMCHLPCFCFFTVSENRLWCRL